MGSLTMWKGEENYGTPQTSVISKSIIIPKIKENYKKKKTSTTESTIRKEIEP